MVWTWTITEASTVTRIFLSHIEINYFHFSDIVYSLAALYIYGERWREVKIEREIKHFNFKESDEGTRMKISYFSKSHIQILITSYGKHWTYLLYFTPLARIRVSTAILFQWKNIIYSIGISFATHFLDKTPQMKVLSIIFFSYHRWFSENYSPTVCGFDHMIQVLIRNFPE